MVAGTALGLGNKILKQDRLGLCLQTGTDQEGKKKKKKKRAKGTSQEYDQAFKGVYCFSNLMTLRFGERSAFRIFGEKKKGVFGMEGLSPGPVEG